MACHQAQYILNEFSTPSVRSNHSSVLSRENSSVNNNNNNVPNGVTYVQRSSDVNLFTVLNASRDLFVLFLQ